MGRRVRSLQNRATELFDKLLHGFYGCAIAGLRTCACLQIQFETTVYGCQRPLHIRLLETYGHHGHNGFALIRNGWPMGSLPDSQMI